MEARKICGMAVTFAVVLLLSACGEKDKKETAAPSTTGTGGTEGAVTFAASIQPIFTAYCSCHTPSGSASFLDLTAGASYGALVNVPAQMTDYSDLTNETRVIPFDSANSVLYRRVTGAADGEDRMPLGGTPLSTTNIGLIKTWIDNGAPNN